MSGLRLCFARLAGLFGGKRSDERLRAELDVHLEMLVEENLRRGMPPAEARKGWHQHPIAGTRAAPPNPMFAPHRR